jgi:DNA-directed RNA polymerase specialized sigma24 family protein
MPELVDLPELINRVHAGDQEAASELVRVFEPHMLRIVRTQMRERADYEVLRRDVSAADICQSVFMSLIVRLRQGRFELNSPEDLKKLLNAMTRLKIAAKARRRSVKWRDILGDDAPQKAMDPCAGPEKLVDDKDLYEVILKLFSLEELQILNGRLDGETWHQIAAAMGGTPDARRRQLERAIERARDNPVVRGLLTT